MTAGEAKVEETPPGYEDAEDRTGDRGGGDVAKTQNAAFIRSRHSPGVSAEKPAKRREHGAGKRDVDEEIRMPREVRADNPGLIGINRPGPEREDPGEGGEKERHEVATEELRLPDVLASPGRPVRRGDPPCCHDENRGDADQQPSEVPARRRAEQSRRDPRQQHRHQDEGPDHRPVHQEIADIERNSGPGVRREQPELGGEIIAVGPQSMQRLRLAVGERISRLGQLPKNRAAPTALDPRGKPGPDIAPARDGGEVVEFPEEIVTRERLDHTQREGGAADAAAGETERHRVVLLKLGIDVADLLIFRLAVGHDRAAGDCRPKCVDIRSMDRRHLLEQHLRHAERWHAITPYFRGLRSRLSRDDGA